MKFAALSSLVLACVAAATTLPPGGKPLGELTVTISSKCNAFACVSAYAGEIAACAAAAAELGLNPVADIACFAALLGAEAVGPICAACLSGL